MTFESLCKIVDGVCLNSPAVNAYEKIETKPHLIKRGDLFVGSDREAIIQAVENGAYGILHDDDTIMIDEEVAWLKVDSTDNALIKLLRFSLLKSDFSFTLFSPIQYALLKKLVPKSLLFLEAKTSDNFKKILSAQKGSHFISQDELFLSSVYPEYTSYNDKHIYPIQLTHKTLFLSSFTYHDKHYEDIKIPSLFIQDLTSVLHYLDEYHLHYELEKLDFTQHFQPLFISNRLTIRPFGHSEHAFIVQSDSTKIIPSLNYINNVATWANILLFLPKEVKIQLDTKITTHHYDTLEEVKNIEVDKFNFILILANYNELSNLLENSKQEKHISLF